jgi:site-specific recombinase XerD
VKKYTKLLWQLEMIAQDPYQYVKFPKGSNKERVPLMENELIKLRQAECTGRIERARDLFIFMAYTGLAYCDMCAFNYKTMTEKHTDYTYIDGERLKTGSSFFTPILPPAMDVLKKYDYKLPVISNQKVNEYLFLLKERLGINKQVTCHIARHSFATLILTYDIPMENLKRMLGHKNIAVTQIYGKILKSNVEKNVSLKLRNLQ